MAAICLPVILAQEAPKPEKEQQKSEPLAPVVEQISNVGQLSRSAVMKALPVFPVIGQGRAVSVPYKPLTREERKDLYLKDTFFSNGALIRPLLGAGTDYLFNRVPVLDGWEAFGRHLGYRVVQQTVARSADYGLSRAMGYEPRYIPCNCQGTGKRVWHAILYSVVTYDTNGKPVANIPRVLSGYAGHYTAMATYPGPYDVWWATRRGTAAVYSGAGTNLLREFAPEIRRLFKK
jgi:hypothetical protein